MSTSSPPEAMPPMANDTDSPSEKSQTSRLAQTWATVGARKRNMFALAAAVAAILLVVLIVVPVVVTVVVLKPKPLVGPHVNLNYTVYVGSQLSNGVNQFLGIRYAAAPVGGLRWRAPVPPPRVDHNQSAHSFRSICYGIGAPRMKTGQSEDCLFANVWAPANATTQSKLPVWVFIQGGGYVALTNANWNGSEVVERSGHNIVLVNFNYRVGMWGFLASERVKNDGDLNVGLLDQRQLLLWVKEHIAKFGGDPDHVVIHGASAGAGSVALHLASYGGRDDHLFVGAVSESLFFPSQPYLAELEWQFDRLAQRLGCDKVAQDAQMSCLRGKSLSELQAANVASAFPGRTAPPAPLFYWTPCVDGEILEDLPYVLFEDGRFIKVPVLFGNDNDEGSYFSPNASSWGQIATFFQNNFPKLTDNDTDLILEHYPLLPALPRRKPWFPSGSRAAGEAVFICPTVNVLSAISASHSVATNVTANATAPGIFSYRYNVQAEENVINGLGVPHIFEAAAIFGPANIGKGGSPSYDTYNAPIVPIVMDYWISFVRALDPNVYRNSGAPEWEMWDGGPGVNGNQSEKLVKSWRRLVIETGFTRMEDVPTEQVERCDFWESMGKITEQKAR